MKEKLITWTTFVVIAVVFFQALKCVVRRIYLVPEPFMPEGMIEQCILSTWAPFLFPLWDAAKEIGQKLARD